MAKRIQLRRGTTAESNVFTGAVGEVTVDTDKDILVVHDGVTAGGHPIAARANTDNSVSVIGKDGAVLGVISNEGLFNNTLSSWSTNMALTANAGRVLNEEIIKTNGSRFGVGQSWGDVTGGKASGVTYTNTSGRPVAVSIYTAGAGGGDFRVELYVNGMSVSSFDTGNNNDGQVFTIVPHGSSYSATIVGFTLGVTAFWRELR